MNRRFTHAFRAMIPLALLALLFPAAVSGQAEKAGSDAPPDQVFHATAEVELVNIDVVVTDPKGKPVRGLTAKDFAIYEDGKAQAITNFEAIDRLMDSVKLEGDVKVAEQQVPPEEVLRVTLFIDNVSLHPMTRNKVVSFSTDFATKVLEKGGEVMIVTCIGGGQIRLPFSRDLKAVTSTLHDVTREMGGGAMHQAQMRQLQAEILAAMDERDAVRSARMYAFQVKNDTERTIQAIRETLRVLSPIEGRKAMIIVTDGLGIDPGADVFRFVELAKAKTTSIAPFLRPEFSLADVMKGLGQSASQANVALYPIHARGLSGFGMMIADESMNWEIASDRIASVKEIGPGKSIRNAQQGERATFANSFVVEQEATLSSRTSLELLAQLTGGFATVGQGDFKKAFESITRDLDVYYTIAYHRSTTDRKKHSILVEVPNTKYKARFRRTYASNTPEDEARDLVTAALQLTDRPKNPLNVTLNVYPATKEKRGGYRIPVEISVPMSSVAALQSATGYNASLRLFVRIADAKKRMTQIGERIATIKIPADAWEVSKNKFYVSQLDLVTEPGEYKIAAAVLDENASQTAIATAFFHAGDLKSKTR